MADLQQVFASNGPLPLRTAVEIQSDLPAVVTMAGSVWSNAPNHMIGISLLIDGELVATATIFANPAQMHLSVVPLEFPHTFEIGPHDFALDPFNNATMSDMNDFYCVTVQH